LLDESDQLAVIRGLQAGDREAWAGLYDAYSVDVWRYVARLIGADAANVADLVQEAFLEAARSARQFDAGRGTLWGWLAGIAHQRVRGYWRQAGRAARLQKLIEGQAGELRSQDNGQAAAKLFEQRELAEVVRHVLAELPVDYSLLLVAKYSDEQSLEQIATQNGGTADAVKSKLARARREFKAKYEQVTAGSGAKSTI
jgi:RNA polymerase sigma-70 factor (ECF subfamily)